MEVDRRMGSKGRLVVAILQQSGSGLNPCLKAEVL